VCGRCRSDAPTEFCLPLLLGSTPTTRLPVRVVAKRTRSVPARAFQAADANWAGPVGPDARGGTTARPTHLVDFAGHCVGPAYLNDGLLSTSITGPVGVWSAWTPCLIWVRDPMAVGSVTRWLLGRCGGATLAARSLVDRHVDRVGAAGLVGAGRKGVTLISDGWAGGARQLPVGLGVEGFQGGGSELTQDVVGAARELASDRQRRAGVRQSAGFEREVVLVVRTGWPARGLRGFEQCPA
jgi:hypothetical protein